MCPPTVWRRYTARVAGPLLDRIDLRVLLSPVPTAQPAHRPDRIAAVQERIAHARGAAAHRWAKHGGTTNAYVFLDVLESGQFALSRSALRPLDTALRTGELTVREARRALRVAWTLADLAGHDRPDTGPFPIL